MSSGRKSDRRGPAVRLSLRPTQWCRLLRLRRMIRAAQQNQDLASDSPVMAVHTDRSAELLLQAQLLAMEGRDDSDAVGELVKLANGDSHALGIAALGARQGGEYHESYVADLTHRLLQAALGGGPVAALDGDERARLLALDSFADLPPSSQWSELLKRQPHLSDLAEVKVKPGDVRHTVRQRLRSRLIRFVGPESGVDDPILRSQVALDAAVAYLMERHEYD